MKFGLTDGSRRREIYIAYCPSNTTRIELEEEKVERRNRRNVRNPDDELARHLCCHAKHNIMEGGVVLYKVMEKRKRQNKNS